MKKDILIIASAFLILFSCKNVFSNLNVFDKVNGEGPVEKITRTASGFTGIELSESADVSVRQGEEFKVLVEAQKNIAELLETVVENSVLKIRFKKGVNANYDKLHIYVQAPNFDKLALYGSGNISAETPLKGQNMQLLLTGSGDIQLQDVNFNALSSTITGSGDIELKNGGNVENADYEVSGSGDITAKDLKAKNVKAQITGSGNIHCAAETSLDALVSGSGDIFYAGTPSVKSRVTGSGNISQR